MNAYEKINNEYIEKRKRAQQAADEKAAALHAKLPELNTIDTELSKTAERIMAEIRKGEQGLAERMSELAERNKLLQERRKKLLIANGLSPDCTDPVYECTKCMDNGYIGTLMCDCFRKALNTEKYLQSGLGSSLEGKTFDTINLGYVCGKPENGVHPREKFKENMDICRAFADNVASKPLFLLMYGGTGLGKTHLTAAVCRAAIDNGCSVVYDSIQSIIRAFWNSPEAAADKYLSCRLLAIDDFGTEFINQHSMSVIYNIINTRMLEERPMLINSNLDAKEFENRYDNRIISRILGSFSVIRFFGQDVRKLMQAGYTPQ